MINLEFSELTSLKDKLINELTPNKVKEAVDDSLYRSTGKFITDVKKNTPVDTGLLQSNWTGGVRKSAGYYFAKTIPIIGNSQTVENNTYYASWVEYGHRGPYGNGWVQGRFYNTRTVNQLSGGALDSVAQKPIDKLMREAFKK